MGFGFEASVGGGIPIIRPLREALGGDRPTAVFGIIDNGPESLRPMWPAVVRVEFLNPTGVKWSIFAENIDPGPNAYQKPQNRGGFERTNDVEFSMDGKTMYIADYGELYVNYQMESPFYTTPKSAVVWTITRE